ncbi:hypothetical protein RSAG8_02743, partial [Rhizoctonia solani AG-8 WAC10335]
MSAYIYNTRDDPKRISGKGADNTRVFETHFSDKNIPLGLNMIDVEGGANYRIASYIKGSEPVKGKDEVYDTTFDLGTWYDTTLINAGCTWLDVSKWDRQLQFGRKNAKGNSDASFSQEYDIKFDRSFEDVPKVVVWFHWLNIDGKSPACVEASAEDVTTNGFKLRYDAPWDDTFSPAYLSVIHECKVSWVAVPQDQPNVKVGTCEALRNGETLSEYKVEVEFDQPFHRTPRVLVALRKIVMLNKHALRIEATAENVTPKGMTVLVKNWGGCDLLRASVDYIAVLD